MVRYLVYEDDHRPIERAFDADMLCNLMEAKGVSQTELHRGTKIAKSTISQILAGKKGFSPQVIPALAEYFEIEESLLGGNLKGNVSAGPGYDRDRVRPPILSVEQAPTR